MKRNKVLCIIFFACHSIINSPLTALQHIGKSHIAFRNNRYDAESLTSDDSLFYTSDKDRVGGVLQATGFYADSTNGVALGEALWAYSKNYMVVSANTPKAFPIQSGQLIIHNYPVGGPLANSVSADRVEIRPRHTRYGVRLAYRQQLDLISKQLSLSVNTLALWVCNNSRLKIVNESPAVQGFTLSSYFAGKSSTNAAPAVALQDPLKFRKVDNADHKKSGIGDVKVDLGWDFVATSSNHATIYGSLVIPTEKPPTGEFLFEPILGSLHWAVGGGIAAHATLWQETNESTQLSLNINYHYFLEAKLKRTIDIHNIARGFPDFGFYALIANNNQPANTRLRPFANDATHDCSITPGSQVDGTVALSYTRNQVSFSLGYNLFYKEAESGFLKEVWKDNLIGVAILNYDIAIAGGIVGGGTAGFIRSLNKTDLDHESILAPSQLTYSFFAGLDYTIQNENYPVIVGVGASYEVAESARTAIEGYRIWGNIGIAF